MFLNKRPHCGVVALAHKYLAFTAGPWHHAGISIFIPPRMLRGQRILDTFGICQIAYDFNLSLVVFLCMVITALMAPFSIPYRLNVSIIVHFCICLAGCWSHFLSILSIDGNLKQPKRSDTNSVFLYLLFRHPVESPQNCSLKLRRPIFGIYDSCMECTIFIARAREFRPLHSTDCVFALKKE